MVELVVVMVVMAVLSAVAAPALMQRSALTERAVTDRLKSLLRQSRGLAIAQQRDLCVLVAPPQARVVYTTAGACNPALPVADPLGAGALGVDLPLDLVLGGALQVQFNARGQPLPAANVSFSVGAQTLTVQRETGAVL